MNKVVTDLNDTIDNLRTVYALLEVLRTALSGTRWGEYETETTFHISDLVLLEKTRLSDIVKDLKGGDAQ